MLDPGTPLRGTRSFAATATDADSGVAQVRDPGASLRDLDVAGPVHLDTDALDLPAATATLARRHLRFRAVATRRRRQRHDVSAVTNRVVDNTVSSVSVDGARATLTARSPLAAGQPPPRASPPCGSSSPPPGRAPGPTSAPTPPRPTPAPGTRPRSATALYDLRGILLDGRGRSTTSARGLSGSSTTPRCVVLDVQSANGGSAAGRRTPVTPSPSPTASRSTSARSPPGGTVQPRRSPSGSVTASSLGLGSNDDTLDVQCPAAPRSPWDRSTSTRLRQARQVRILHRDHDRGTVTRAPASPAPP